MERTQPDSISSYDLIDAKLGEQRMSESKECPNCGHKFDPKPDWVGLPNGVKFDPTDQELIEHLEAKVNQSDGPKSHPLIDEFIPTIEGEDGICYTHPEKLPGVTKDGLSKHFFHRPSKAYTTGTRKRRKIHTDCDIRRGETRWHKTGKTRPVIVNGRLGGCKKILVLYTNFGKHRKPEKTNWVMHQYHLGSLEDEREGELVVSKIFYQTQPRQSGSAVTASVGSVVSLGEEAMRNHSFGFATFTSGFDQVPSELGAECEEREQSNYMPMPHHVNPEERQRQVPQIATFHVSTPGNPVSATLVQPPLQQASLVLSDAYQNILTSDRFEQQQQVQKFDSTSATGLEEMILGCTSTDPKGESSNVNSQATEWQYSFWPTTDSRDQHR